MIEIWELVDEKKQKTGELHERELAETIPCGRYHIVVQIFVRTENGELLLTRRHPNKLFGLMWECTMGSVLAGETSLEGAMRELAEETGIVADEKCFVYLGDTYYDNWIVDTYLYTVKVQPTLRLQEGEVVDAKFVPFLELSSLKASIVGGVWRGYEKFRDKITKNY